MNVRKNEVNELFKKLRKAGYIARQNFACCSSCASYELGELCESKGIPEDSRKVVYYHRQDTDRFWKTGKLFLGWSGNGDEIKQLALDAGLSVEWDGTHEQRIQVS